MRAFAARVLKGGARRLGIDLANDDFLAQLPPATRAIIAQVRPYTMTSPQRLAALVDAIDYIERRGIAGDVVECGVWRGGSTMAAALALADRGNTARELFLYDTFEGMSEPTEHDRETQGGASADAMLASANKDALVWCYAGLEEVKANVARTGYPVERLHFVRGKVEETIPATMPGTIALLRLDTDWYESTRHELEHLFPLLAPGGVLIIDDYGHWEGARKAVDEYFAVPGRALLLSRIDYTGRLAVKV